tara:strand:- start:12 stop:575 length:564 start_codon:yes stop_codon:yes gene_type:complete
MIDKLKAIIKLSHTESEAEKLLMDEIAKDNLFQTLELEDIGVSIDELGLTVEDIDNNDYMYGISENEGEEEEFAKAKTVNLYRYVAHSSSGYGGDDLGKDSRSFCKVLVRRTRLSLMRYVDILKLNGANKGMGLNGANVYSVFKWRGGVNCKHIWVKYVYDIEAKKLVVAPKSEQPKQTGKGGVPNA